METIFLTSHEWKIDTARPIGSPGGFGEVFCGEGSDGPVAIKRLKLTAAQAVHRELQIGKGLQERDLINVVPILDVGQDPETDRYYIVMPVCDYSLQDRIDSTEPTISITNGIEAILAILSGLDEVSDITHRDLKPANVLFHNGVWKIADFGIAKFVEDSTSLETLRTSLTPTYAAPEQWLSQRPTSATDIYAVGCIAHSLFSGQPPFTGDIDALRELHLNHVAPSIINIPARARALVSQMLRKQQEVRPKCNRCIKVFKEISEVEDQSPIASNSALSEAISAVTIEHAEIEAKEQERKERLRLENLLFRGAAEELENIKNKLVNSIRDQAEDIISTTSPFSTIALGNGSIEFETATDSPVHGIKQIGGDVSSWGRRKPQSTWNILAIGEISVTQASGSYKPNYTRSANLIFGRSAEYDEYRWYELSFFRLGGENQNKNPPYSLEYIWEIDEALSKVLTDFQLAHPPKPIDGEDEEMFIQYWIELLAQAATRSLKPPSQLPINR